MTMNSQLVSRITIQEKAEGWQNQLDGRTEHERRIYEVGFRAGLKEAADAIENERPTCTFRSSQSALRWVADVLRWDARK